MTKEELLEELIAEEMDRSATAATHEASEDAERWIAIYKQRLDAFPGAINGDGGRVVASPNEKTPRPP